MTTNDITATEQRVLAACRSAPKYAAGAGLNAPLTWGLMDKATRPRVRTVLQHLYALARKGALVKTGPMQFSLPIGELTTERIQVPIPPAEELVPATAIDKLDVVCHEDASLTIHADAVTLARLVGRSQFGELEPVQTALRDRIADAWYAANCPRATR